MIGISRSFTSARDVTVFASLRKWWNSSLPWRPPKALVEQAAIALRRGDRFQFPLVAIESEQNIRPFIVSVTKILDENVRASMWNGAIVLYLDDGVSEGLGITLALLQ